jgi:adenylyltransferase/sulfurtransferase
MVVNIDAVQLKDWIAKNEVLLIDVREEGEYATGKIADAVLMPRSEILNGEIVLDDVINLNKGNKKVVFYCRSGMRSNDVCKFFSREGGGMDFYNLSGGILYFDSEVDVSNVGACCPF